MPPGGLMLRRAAGRSTPGGGGQTKPISGARFVEAELTGCPASPTLLRESQGHEPEVVTNCPWLLAVKTMQRIPSLLQQLEHALGRAADHGTVAAYHDRPLDEDGMLCHRIEHLVVRTAGIELRRLIFRLALADPLTRGEPKLTAQRCELGARRRFFEILDDAQRHLTFLE